MYVSMIVAESLSRLSAQAGFPVKRASIRRVHKIDWFGLQERNSDVFY
jgi:hypothetical protein